MDERARFVGEWNRRKLSITRLCEVFGISRKTGHKWLNRFRGAGPAGLVDKSRAPQSCPHAMSADVADAIVAARTAHRSWGPRKLLAWLHGQDPELILPAASSAGDLLKRRGFVEPRRCRRRFTPRRQPFAACLEPNATWCADFKGEFTVGDRTRCYPLTIMDAWSRYLLCCHGLAGTREPGVRPLFERAFRDHGLPQVIRTDNGPPFASHGLAGLSRLSVWWIRLGIVLERIAPGKPQENGRHERMHLTLKRETAQRPRTSMAAQQAAFDAFRREYNDDRPHEALGQRPPASAYRQSPRSLPRRLPEPEYATNVALRRVQSNGTVKWRGTAVFLSEALRGELVGLEEIEDGVWVVSFGPLDLGALDTAGQFTAAAQWSGLTG